MDQCKGLPRLNRKTDTTVLSTPFFNKRGRSLGIEIKNTDTVHRPITKQSRLNAVKTDQLHIFVPGVAGNAQKQVIDFLKFALDNLQKMGFRGQQNAGNAVIPVVNFAGTDNFVNQAPVNGAVAATFVDESVHAKKYNKLAACR